MKNLLLLSTAFSIMLFTISCSPKRYITQDYHQHAKSHKKIAVLPYANFYTGRIPKDFSIEDLIALQEEESVLFQRSLYFQLLEESRNHQKNDIYVSIEDINITNAKLQEAGITIKDTWKKDPTELAEILGVDAVVKVDLHKDYFLTNEESAIINVATTVFSGVINRTTAGINTRRLGRTSEMYVNATLIDGDAGVSLWAYNKKYDTDWQCETDEAISRINHKISKRFPYRRNL